MVWKKILLEGDAATLSDSTPQPIGTTASAGTATDASRSDHVHTIGDGAINSSTMFASGVVDNNALADGAVTVSKINIDANLSFNENEAVEMALENLSSEPTTSKVGRIYFNTTDNHPYVYTG